MAPHRTIELTLSCVRTRLESRSAVSVATLLYATSILSPLVVLTGVQDIPNQELSTIRNPVYGLVNNQLRDLPLVNALHLPSCHTLSSSNRPSFLLQRKIHKIYH